VCTVYQVYYLTQLSPSAKQILSALVEFTSYNQVTRGHMILACLPAANTAAS